MEKRIFKKGSTTFFFSTLLFTRTVRKDVFDLYSFLRVSDDYVDEHPTKPKKLAELKKLWDLHASNLSFDTSRKKTDTLNLRVIKNIIRLGRVHAFENVWVPKFLDAMQSDLNFKGKNSLSDSLTYCEGSAEVVGLMMSRIMNLPKELDDQARLLGRAFQWMNFIRDVHEDNQLGRCYFPREDLKKFGLKDLSKETALNKPDNFNSFMFYQIDRYTNWRDEAKVAFASIPKRRRLPLLVATDSFDWTIEQIGRDPQAVFDKKIKPRKSTIIFFVFKRII